jgi:opacity protein-like surface antigen
MTRALPSLALACTFFAVLGATSAAAQQQGGIRFSIHDKDGKPLADVQLVLVLANQNKVAAGTTDNSGNGNVALNIANLGKVRVQIEVEECDDGSKAVLLSQSGTQLPEPKEGCRRRRIAIVILWDGGQQVTIDFDRGTAEVTHVGRVEGPPGHSPFWFEGDGGLGFKNFPGASAKCETFTQFPGGTCDASSNSLTVDASASIHLPGVFVGGGFVRTNAFTINANAPLAGGVGTDSLVSNLQPWALYATGGVSIPLGNGISFRPQAGAARVTVNIEREDKFLVGTTPTTSTDSRQFTQTGPILGADIDFPVTHHLGIEVSYKWVQFKNLLAVDEHNHIVVIKLRFRLPGK